MPTPAVSAPAGGHARASLLGLCVLALAGGFTWLLGSGSGSGRSETGALPVGAPAAPPRSGAAQRDPVSAAPDPAREPAARVAAAPPAAPAPALPAAALLVCRLDPAAPPDPAPAWSVLVESTGLRGRSAEPVRAGAGERALELRLAAGDWRARALAPGWHGPWETVRVSTAAAQAGARVELVLALRPAAAVSGVVLRQDGEPAAGIYARALSADGATLAAAYADEAGVFLLADVPLGPAELALGAPDFAVFPARAFEVLPPRVDLEPCVLPPACDVAVRVVDASGLPAAGARVRTPASPRAEQGEVLTDAGGRALLRDLPAGPGRILADHDGLGRGNTAARFAPGEELEVEVVLRTRRP